MPNSSEVCSICFQTVGLKSFETGAIFLVTDPRLGLEGLEEPPYIGERWAVYLLQGEQLAAKGAR